MNGYVARISVTDECIAVRFFYTLLIHRKQSRFATCSLTREGFCEPSISATDSGAFCDQNELGPPRTSVPTIKK